MNAIAIALMFLVTAAMAGSIGYGVRGWQDGTIVTAKSATDTAQLAADKAATAAVNLMTATQAKTAAREQLNRSIAGPVSRECEPGTGAVSDAALERLREATK